MAAVTLTIHEGKRRAIEEPCLPASSVLRPVEI